MLYKVALCECSPISKEASANNMIKVASDRLKVQPGSEKEKMIQLQGEQIKQPELIRAETDKKAQDFELQKMREQFNLDYILKYTVPYGTPVPEQNGNK